ncbi:MULTISPECIES: hypothetical protein [Cohnella]|uniref:hypothetical protein n=1 Tax=Cohnella TaxID=329857 RepID=UPI0009BA870A|nr:MULTISPECIES: hypothetical protein [Cohnella]MBN2982511.1 hypothetical protein [Cohnella algarum]
MEKNEKVKVLFNLFELVNFYYESRDKPSGVNFFEELDQYCKLLDIDFDEFKKQFGINTGIN